MASWSGILKRSPCAEVCLYFVGKTIERAFRHECVAENMQTMLLSRLYMKCVCRTCPPAFPSINVIETAIQSTCQTASCISHCCENGENIRLPDPLSRTSVLVTADLVMSSYSTKAREIFYTTIFFEKKCIVSRQYQRAELELN